MIWTYVYINLVCAKNIALVHFSLEGRIEVIASHVANNI